MRTPTRSGSRPGGGQGGEGCPPARYPAPAPGEGELLPSPPTFWLVRSRGDDPALAGVGSSPHVGDIGWQQHPVPATFTTDFSRRTKITLCGYAVPPNRTARIFGLEQAARIGFDVELAGAEGQPPTLTQSSIPITDPDFRFPDGNIAWGLRYVPGRVQSYRLHPTDDPLPIGFTPIILGTETATQVVTITPYVPPGGGLFDGQPVGALGNFNDIAFPRGNTEYFEYFVEGPGVLLLQCSVFQTNPLTRRIWTPPEGFDRTTLTREQQLLITATTASLPLRYTSVFGAIRMDMGPDPKRFNQIRNPRGPVREEPCDEPPASEGAPEEPETP